MVLTKRICSIMDIIATLKTLSIMTLSIVDKITMLISLTKTILSIMD